MSYEDVLTKEKEYEDDGIGCYIYYHLKGPDGEFWYVFYEVSLRELIFAGTKF